MTVVAKGEGELTASVDEGASPLVLEALGDYAGVAQDSLDHTPDQQERTRLEARLEQIATLQAQLHNATGTTHLTGPEELVAGAVKAAASIATHDLDTRVCSLTTSKAPLSARGQADLRARGTRLTACLETLIACEGSRHRG